MTVSPQEVYEMARLRAILNGGPMPEPPMGSQTPLQENKSSAVELLGPGQVGNKEISAMADVLKKLNSITDDVAEEMVLESSRNTEVRTAITTSVNETGVKVGAYQIEVLEDTGRMAGKQYYNIKHIRSGDTIAEQITLYETALSAVKLLNQGFYVNNIKISKLFEYDTLYASHKVDALSYKRKSAAAAKNRSLEKQSLYEARQQASVQRAMEVKRNLKDLISHL
jgi:hypothetical protein